MFSGCKNLTIDQFEAGGKKLEDRVFSEVRINTLKISGTLEAYSMYRGCFQGADVGKVEISDYTFRGCEWLKAIELPDSILNIGNSAFSNCTNLKTITISSVVYKIGRNAFSDCGKLTIITPSGSVAEAYAIENNIPVKHS